MSKQLYFTLAIILLTSVAVFAQHGKIINKDFVVDTYNTVDFDLYGEMQFEQWEADYILVETTIKLWDTPKRLFTDFLNKGRYQNELKATDDKAVIRSVPIKRVKLGVEESVVSVIYYPASFVVHDSKMVRQQPVLSSKEEKE